MINNPVVARAYLRVLPVLVLVALVVGACNDQAVGW